MSKNSELKFTPIEGEEVGQLVEKYFDKFIFHHGHIRCEGTFLPGYFKKFADEILNFKVRDDDTWVCSFPKTGTTWSQEMVWCIANDLDMEGAKVNLQERFPFLEICALVDHPLMQSLTPNAAAPRFIEESLTFIRNMPSPRFIKSHLPLHLLPLQLQQGNTKAKVVYTARNAKDTCVSYYYHTCMFEGCTATLEEFAFLFINDAVINAPFWGHVLPFWEKREDPKFLFLKYEDMKKDLPSEVRKTTKFLEKTLTDTQVDALCEHLSFESMRDNKAVNFDDLVETVKKSNKSEGGKDLKFMRSGKVGDGQRKLSTEWNKRFDEWSEKNLKGTNLLL